MELTCVKARGGLHGALRSGDARKRVQVFCPGGQNLDAGRIHFARADENGYGNLARPAAPGAAGAHIAELIHTMLEKKASGIDLKL